MKRLTLDLNRLIQEANGEIELVSYFVKLTLLEYGIPMIINCGNISWQPLEVEYGNLDWRVDVEEFTLEIEYAR